MTQGGSRVRGVVSESREPRQAGRQGATASCPEAPGGRKNPDKTAGSSRNGSRAGGCSHQEGFRDLAGQELPQGCGPQHGQQTRPTGALPRALPYLLLVPAPATAQRDPGLRRVSWTLRQRPAALGLTLKRPSAGASPHAVAPCLRSTAPRSCLTKNVQSTPARAQVHPGAHRGDTSQGAQGPGRTKSPGHSVPSPPCGADKFTQCVRAPFPELARPPVLGATGLPRAPHPFPSPSGHQGSRGKL